MARILVFAAVLLSCSAAGSAAALPVILSNVPPEANKAAIVVDDSAGVRVAEAVFDVSGSTANYTFSAVPGGPLRVRSLAYSTVTYRPLRSGRVSVTADGTAATVILGDVYAPFPTTGVNHAAHGSKQYVSFRMSDPGGWLEGSTGYINVSRNSSQVQKSFVFKNQLNPGSWDFGANLQMPLTDYLLNFYAYVVFTVPGTDPPPLILYTPDYLQLYDAHTVTLTLAGIPPTATSAMAIVDGCGLEKDETITFSTTNGQTGTVFGLPAGSPPCRVRVAALTTAENGTLLASGQSRLVLSSGTSTMFSVPLQAVTATLDGGIPSVMPRNRVALAGWTVTDPGAVLEGMMPVVGSAPILPTWRDTGRHRRTCTARPARTSGALSFPSAATCRGRRRCTGDPGRCSSRACRST